MVRVTVEVVGSTTAAAPGGALPRTGAEVALLVVAAVALLVTGVLLVVLSRTRLEAAHHA